MKQWFAYSLGGLKEGNQPSDYIDYDKEFGKCGAVAYKRILSDWETDHYRLIYLGEGNLYDE